MRKYLEIGTSDFSTLNSRFDGRAGWSGCSVEAVPEYFGRLAKNSKNSYLNRVVVADDRKSVPFWFVPSEAIKKLGLPGYLRGCGSMREDHPSLSKFAEHVKKVELPCIHVKELLDKGVLDLLKVDTEGADYEIVNAVLDAGCWPTHIVFETCLMSPPLFVKLNDKLRTIGYAYRGREGDNVQYSFPSVLAICDTKWSTGSIVRDLQALSMHRITMLDWAKRPPDLSAILSEFDAVASFTLNSPHAWPELANHGVICCGEVDITLNKGRKILGRRLGAVSPETCLALTRKVTGSIRILPTSVRLGRFKRREARPIRMLGWCGVPASGKYFGSDLKRHRWFEEIVSKAGVSGKVSNRDYTYETMQTFYDSVDMLVCTSISEGGPLPVFEAIACGVPVISTDVGLVKEFSSIPKFENVDEAVRMVKTYVESPKLAQTLAHKQYEELSGSAFSFEAAYPKWDRFFDACSFNEARFL